MADLRDLWSRNRSMVAYGDLVPANCRTGANSRTKGPDNRPSWRSKLLIEISDLVNPAEFQLAIKFRDLRSRKSGETPDIFNHRDLRSRKSSRFLLVMAKSRSPISSNSSSSWNLTSSRSPISINPGSKWPWEIVKNPGLRPGNPTLSNVVESRSSGPRQTSSSSWKLTISRSPISKIQDKVLEIVKIELFDLENPGPIWTWSSSKSSPQGWRNRPFRGEIGSQSGPPPGKGGRR